MAKKNIDYTDWTKDDLVKEIKRIKDTTYGLVWHRDVPQEKLDILINPDARTPEETFANEVSGKPFPVLQEVKSKAIITDPQKTVNLLIEGDNYHSLAVLNFTHQESVDVIYIDPPYNTGNNDFIYNDKFVDKEDSFRHSKWLSFMDKRLRLSRFLMKNDGVIFISIDDNEQAPLKMLCDEIFGEQNFVSTIIWQRSYSPKNQSRHISVDHEYVLVYAKNIEALDLHLLPRTDKMNARYRNIDNDPRGPWKPGDLVANEERKSGHYIITGPNGDKFDSPSGKHWSYAQAKMIDLQKDNRLYFGKNGTAFPSLKQFLTEVQQGRKASTLFLHEEVGHTDEAKKELKGFFEQSDNLFSTPKPTRLIKQLVQLTGKKDAVILDFMAGSGTTAEAILDLNKTDNGTRTFILCTNNGDEKSQHKIATDICYPRIKKSITGYTSTRGQKIESLGGNLRYFTAYDFVESEPTDRNKRKLVKKSTEMLCIKEGVYDSVIETEEFKILKNHQNKYIGIIFYEDAIDAYKKELKKIKHKVITYVFSLGDDPHRAEFADVADKVELQPIPEVILRVYREIFK